MRKLLRHGRNSKPSSGNSWHGNVVAVTENYDGFLGAMMGDVTTYTPGTLSIEYYDWVPEDNIDIYLFGTFSKSDIHLLEVYVDGVKTTASISDVTEMWQNEFAAMMQDFDSVIDVYFPVPLDRNFHTVEIKTLDGTIVEEASIKVTSDPGTNNIQGTVYKRYQLFNRIYLGEYNSSTDTYGYQIDQALVVPPSNELWEGIVLEPTDGVGILGKDITIEYDDTILAPWSSNAYSIIDRQGITQNNGQTVMFLCADVIKEGSFSTYVTIKKWGAEVGKFEIFR